MKGSRILTASDRALLVESDDLTSSMALHHALEGADLPGVVELIPAARTILVRYDPLRTTAADLSARIRATPVTSAATTSGDVVTVPVVYDGEDLADVAELLHLSSEEVVARHTGATWQVAFTGFAPGFGYLVCDDPIFDVPRRASPRTRVPAGSVGLAGLFSGVYPRASPGGWQLIGRTEATLWDLHRDPPALFVPGTTVRFEAVDPVDLDTHDASAVLVDQRPTNRRIEVVRAPLPVLVQDLGRAGHAALGVSASGAADRISARTANRAVGNSEDAAVLELIGGGVVLRFTAETVAAVTGAAATLTLTTDDGTKVPITLGAPFAVEAGDELTVGAPAAGLRTVVGIRGGIVDEPALGSRATDTLAGLGPEPRTAGSWIDFGDPHRAPSAVHPGPAPTTELPRTGEVTTLEITLGPRDDWFTAAGLTALTEQDWQVTPRSDRVGIRLHGERPLERAREGELPSEGAVTGAIQVPPDGQPVLFLADHPLTGGYPIIGAVTDRCLDLAGQLPPGALVRFCVERGGRPPRTPDTSLGSSHQPHED